MPLRRHLALLVLGAVVPLLAFAIWTVVTLNAERRASVERGLRDTTAALALAMDRELEATVTTLEALGASADPRPAGVASFRRQLSSVLQSQEMWLDIALIDATGSVVTTARPAASEAQLGAAERQDLMADLGAGRSSVSNAFVETRSGRRVVRVSVPIGRDGPPGYMLSALVGTEAFAALVAAQRVPSDSAINVLDRTATIVARSRRPELVGRQPPAAYVAAVQAQAEGFARVPTLEGDELYAAWRRTKTGWTVALGIQTDVIDRPLYRALLVVIAGGLVLAAVAAGVAVVFGQRIARDLDRLAGAAAAVDRGEMVDSALASVSEFGAVGRTLEATAADQRRYAERLRGLHAIDQAILSGGSPAVIGNAALRRLRRLLDVPRVTLALYDRVRGVGEWIAVDTARPTVLPARTTFPLALMGDIERLERGEPNVLERASVHDPSVAQALVEEGIASYIVVPMLVDGELIGSLNFGMPPGGIFDGDDVQTAREVAAQMAVAIRQAQLHDALASRAEQLEARVSERTAALSELNAELEAFAYTVSHDLRAPLRGMQGLAQALLEDYGETLEPTGRDYATRIAVAAAHMDRLIHDLLTYSRLAHAALKLEVTSLDAIVHDARAQLCEQLAGADVAVEGALPSVVGHRATLVQVVVNLLSNAAKYVAPGTRARIRMRAERGNGVVRLWVEDNGIGIAAKHRDRIFKVFERLHGEEMYSGTGIGLAIVRKAVERMGGQAGVEADEGHGSRFWIELADAHPKRETIDGAA